MNATRNLRGVVSGLLRYKLVPLPKYPRQGCVVGVSLIANEVILGLKSQGRRSTHELLDAGTA